LPHSGRDCIQRGWDFRKLVKQDAAFADIEIPFSRAYVIGFESSHYACSVRLTSLQLGNFDYFKAGRCVLCQKEKASVGRCSFKDLLVAKVDDFIEVTSRNPSYTDLYLSKSLG
jgi:hypothetical protein